MKHTLLLILNILNTFIATKCSIGDSSQVFQHCYNECTLKNCSVIQNELISNSLWSCNDNCNYICMWITAKTFQNKGWPVPQFYGKWPFIRFMGLQEPASVLFSSFNLFAHIYNLNHFIKTTASESPMYFVWIFYSLVCMHAWIWSMIFHARDVPFTESMDYFCAFSMVLLSFLISLIRVTGRNKVIAKILISFSTLSFFCYHVWYLSMKKFDYGYNMKVNVTAGVLNVTCWIFWCQPRLKSRPYVKWCQRCLIVLSLTTLLELFDFPPIFWTFDAHALWHLSTSFLPFMWYRFIEGDCLYMLQSKKSKGASEDIKNLEKSKDMKEKLKDIPEKLKDIDKKNV